MPVDTAPHPTVVGEVLVVGDRLLVCRYPVSTSLPIPLGVKAPAAAVLLTWAFAGLDGAPGAVPHGLLVVAAPDAAACDRLVVETHYRDVAITLVPGPDLSAEDRAILCQAVLAAVEPGTIDALSALFPMLLPAMRAMPVPKDAPELSLTSERTGTLSGYVVPDYLVLTAGSRLACRRVEATRLRFGTTTLAELTLAPQGALGGPPDGALLVGGGTVVRARLCPGAEIR